MLGDLLSSPSLRIHDPTALQVFDGEVPAFLRFISRIIHVWTTGFVFDRVVEG